MQKNIAHDLDEKTRTKDVILEENVSFDSLLLRNDILKGLKAAGFRKPSPVQFKALPLGRCGFDLIVKSKSGTGKTLVFSIIALETVNVSRNTLQVLILVPTREIAVQIQDVLRKIGACVDGLCVESFIGGLPLEDDLKKVKHCHIAVGAPGRVKHLISVGALSTKAVKLFILDEADKLMDRSFQSDINEIYNALPQRKQLIASSATYPNSLDIFLANYMLSPTHVTSEHETPLLLGLRQFAAIVKTNNPNVVQVMKAKNETLVEIFTKISFTQCLVYSNYQTRAESVSNYLNQKAWPSSFVSAAQSQTKRLEAVNNLKDFKSRILLSTDLTSRGIDACNVDLVINYDIPGDAVTYLHRIGRAGRYGSPGICISLVAGDEVKQLQNILGTIGATNLSIPKLPALNVTNDLWQLDPNTLEQVHGVVPSESTDKISEEIKKEVMALKQTGNAQNKTKRNKNGEKKIKLEELTDCNLVNDILSEREKMIEENFELSTVDTENILNSLLFGTKIENDDDSKKRKRNEDTEIKKEKQTNYRKDVIFAKNKALLTVTRLLHDYSVTIDPYMVDSIEEYIAILKNVEFEDTQKTIAEVLDCDGSNVDNAVKHTDPQVTEDIFHIAYECAIGQNPKSWLDHLSSEEMERFRHFCSDELAVSSEDEDDEDFEMEDFEEEASEEVEVVGDDPNQDLALQWVPVTHDETSLANSNDHFTQCYENCSNALWQTGLSFETVDEFDQWFYQWQEQLQSVRNYVQQNIYVDEMSKYQQSRLTDK